MKRLIHASALLALVAFLAPAASNSALAQETPKGDMARLQGTWSGKVGPNLDIPIAYTFEGEKVTVTIKLASAGREVTLNGKYRVDESTRPKAIDWIEMGDATGKKLPETKGIYSLDSNHKLRLCNAQPGATDRPPAFDEDVPGRAPTLVLTQQDPAETPKAAEPPKEKAPVPCAEIDDKDKPKDVKEEPLKGDLAKLQGNWTAKVGPDQSIPLVITFKGNAVTIKVTTPDNGDIELKGEFKLDENGKPHKTIDWTKFTSPMGDEVPDNLGIYEFVDADTLRSCGGGPGNPRPTEFKGGEGGPPNLVTLKREKAEKPAEKAKEEKEKAADEKLTGDTEKLQGTWTALVGPEKNIPITLVVKGTDVDVTFTTPAGEDRSMKGKLKIDAGVKPKTIDWVGFKQGDGTDAPDNLGIYTLEADEFTVCNGGRDNPRPTEFKAGEGGPPMLFTFTRKK